ncbi:MAG: NUDIX hydrolase [Spirosomaceae bacterium]|nr:NUDIX hydrolase [Spirosomataceae bacterium]
MLPTHTELFAQIGKYNINFPAEAKTVKTFQEFVKRNAENSVFDRKNFDGHFTASAFLLNNVGTHLLFLQHKKLNRWLQPGGHIDDTDESILEAALREVEEETGLQRTDLKVVSGDIFDLDAHAIPENPKKDEAAHIHFDVRYLFKVTNESNIKVNLGEAEDLKWVTFDEVKTLDGFERVGEKLERLKRI